MVKKVDDSVPDAALNVIAGATEMYICSGVGEITNRADAIARSLADTTLTGGDFTLADGDVSGRKVTVAAQSNILVDTTGTAEQVALCTASLLLHTTDVTAPQLLTASNTVSTAAYDHEIEDPT